MNRETTVLVVEDDEAVRELLAVHLWGNGFAPLEAPDTQEAWRLLPEANLVILDRMLPGESGDSFLQRLRSSDAFGHLPVLMLTARATEADKVAGLEGGADDYLTKPFSAAELVARIRSLLRRAGRQEYYRAGEVVINLAEGTATLAGEPVELTRREFELLAFLAAHPGRVFSRAELLDRVWGIDFTGTERTVDQHVAQLRHRLGSEIVRTVHGRGYSLGTGS